MLFRIVFAQSLALSLRQAHPRAALKICMTSKSALCAHWCVASALQRLRLMDFTDVSSDSKAKFFRYSDCSSLVLQLLLFLAAVSDRRQLMRTCISHIALVSPCRLASLFFSECLTIDSSLSAWCNVCCCTYMLRIMPIVGIPNLLRIFGKCLPAVFSFCFCGLTHFVCVGVIPRNQSNCLRLYLTVLRFGFLMGTCVFIFANV